MRFVTWNIQRGGGPRLPSIIAELKELDADVITLTEVTAKNLAEIRRRLVDHGYPYLETTCDQAGVNSVLVASKWPLTRESAGPEYDKERWLSVSLGEKNLRVLSVHIPGSDDSKSGKDGTVVAGKRRKELFWQDVIAYAHRHHDEQVVILGDFNTGLPADAEGTPFVHSDYIRVLQQQENCVDTWRSLHPDAREFTWYSRRTNKELRVSEDHNGFRLDYVFVSAPLLDAITSAKHIHEVRRAKISDHSIVVADLALDPSGG